MLTYYLLTKEGKRIPNEDSIGMVEEDGVYCFAVADGLGGHGKGEVASALVVEKSLTKFVAEPKGDTILAEAFDYAQSELLRLQREKRSQNEMKSTLVLLRIKDNFAQWAHIGDSRLYYFCKGKLKLRTLDHSVPQMLVASRQIREKDIRHHSDRNRLLRVMGMEWPEPRYEVAVERELKSNKKQAFLMCSDGFWELIDEKAMEKCLKTASSPEEWVLAMEKIVLENGADTNMDNYTALGIFVE